MSPPDFPASGRFDPVALPPDRTFWWLIAATLFALAVLLWAAWEDHHADREPRFRPTIHDKASWVPAPRHQERGFARLEETEERP